MRMTLKDVTVIIGASCLLALFAFLMLYHPPHDRRTSHCRDNLNQIGKAIFTYTQANNEYYPFAWDTCDRWLPSRDNYDFSEGPYIARADVSIGLLYPDYLDSARMFRCPSVRIHPSFEVNVPVYDGKKIIMMNDQCLPDTSTLLPGTEHLWEQRNYTLLDSGYGYDPRIYTQWAFNNVIFGDMSAAHEGHASTGGPGNMNLLHVDGHVSWESSNFCSGDLADNIFAENPWNADTDSYLVRTTAMLRKSYDGYPELQRNP